MRGNNFPVSLSPIKRSPEQNRAYGRTDDTNGDSDSENPSYISPAKQIRCQHPGTDNKQASGNAGNMGVQEGQVRVLLKSQQHASDDL